MLNENQRLEFNHKIMIEYHEHTKLPKDLIFNPNSRTFTSFNEKGVHIWNPETGENLFQIAFEIGGNYEKFEISPQQISCNSCKAFDLAY